MDAKEFHDRMAAAEAMSSLSKTIFVRGIPGVSDKKHKNKRNSDSKNSKPKRRIPRQKEKNDKSQQCINVGTESERIPSIISNTDASSFTTSVTSTSAMLPTTVLEKNLPNMDHYTANLEEEGHSHNANNSESNNVSPHIEKSTPNSSNQRRLQFNNINIDKLTQYFTAQQKNVAGASSHVTPEISKQNRGGEKLPFVQTKLRERLLGGTSLSNSKNLKSKMNFNHKEYKNLPTMSLEKEKVDNRQEPSIICVGSTKQKQGKTSAKPLSRVPVTKKTVKNVTSELDNRDCISFLPSNSLIGNMNASDNSILVKIRHSQEGCHSKMKNTIVTNVSFKEADSTLPLKKRRFLKDNELPSKFGVKNSTSLSFPLSGLKLSQSHAESVYKENHMGSHIPCTVDDCVQRTEPSSTTEQKKSSSLTSDESSSSLVFHANQIVRMLSTVETSASGNDVKVDPELSMKILSEIHAALTPDEDGDLPLHIAVVQEHLPLTKKFVQLMQIAQKTVDKYNKDQQTPLHLAVKLKFVEGIKVLLKANANPNLVDKTGSSALHLAVKENSHECLHMIMDESEHNLEFNIKDFEGMAPLHTAVLNNNVVLAAMLLCRELNIDNMDGKSGRTPLFHAAERRYNQMVSLLIRYHANPDIANYAGVTPLAAAQSRNLNDISSIMSRGLSEIIGKNTSEPKGAKEHLSNFLAVKAERSHSPEPQTDLIMDCEEEISAITEPMDLTTEKKKCDSPG